MCFLLYRENGDFSILMKDMLVDMYKVDKLYLLDGNSMLLDCGLPQKERQGMAYTV